jgi:hypothetical protein
VARLLAGRAPTGRTLASLARVIGWPPIDAIDHRGTASRPDRLTDDEDAA